MIDPIASYQRVAHEILTKRARSQSPCPACADLLPQSRAACHRNTFVTRTPSSVSIKISSPRATNRPLEVSSTGARLWRLSSTTSPGFRSASWVSVRLTRPSSTVSVTGTSRGDDGRGSRGRALTNRGVGSWVYPQLLAATIGSRGRGSHNGIASTRTSRPAESSTGRAGIRNRHASTVAGRVSGRRGRLGLAGRALQAANRRAARRRPAAAV